MQEVERFPAMGHFYVKGIGMIEIPTLVNRASNNKAWLLDRKRFKQNYFGDATYGSAKNSLREAMRVFLSSIDFPLTKIHSVRTKEYANKRIPTGLAGVFYDTQRDRFVVFLLNKRERAYVRVASDDPVKYNAAKATAIQIRQDAIAAFNRRHKCDLSYMLTQLGL